MPDTINAEELEKEFLDCFYNEEELKQFAKAGGDVPASAVVVEGITCTFGFQKDRLEAKREKVKAWLALLPDTFQKNNGGGTSFLQACVTRYGDQWGEHRNVEQLMVLAVGLKLGSWCFPRDMWKLLPGGVPYFVIE